TPLEAARMSTGNPTGVDAAKDTATRDFLWRHAHATPFEMAVLQIEVQVPIFVAREWMRHRTQSFNEFSGRYAEMPALYYQPSPERVQGQSETNKQASSSTLSDDVRSSFLDSIAADQTLIRDHYEEYLEAGVARELARINLPLSQYTRFRAQANLRNWLHFLNLRMAPNAQYEIRVYAHALADLIQLIWPETWAVFAEHTLEGAQLSRTERNLVTRLLADALGAEDPAALAQALEAKIGTALNKSKTREFLVKLGLPSA
ncbi:MAG TPA: FAD-dependent thymidylate synthase, partial [Stenomitos sp.]